MRIGIVVCMVLCVAVCCRKDSAQDHDHIRVVTTIEPLTEFVEQVGGDRVRVMTMVPSGASPHTYEPTPGQMTRLSTAQLYIKVGTSIEFELVWLDKLLKMNDSMRVCNVSEHLVLLKTDVHTHDTDHTGDPHVWLSLRNASSMIEIISDALSSIDPAHEDEYRKNAHAYQDQLDSLDRTITRLLAEKERRMFITYHAAWHYFATDYDLEQQVIEVNNKEPSARTIQHIIEIAGQHGVRVIFASPQFDRKYAENIARAIDGQVIFIDPLAKQYIENMDTIARTLGHYME